MIYAVIFLNYDIIIYKENKYKIKVNVLLLCPLYNWKSVECDMICI